MPISHPSEPKYRGYRIVARGAAKQAYLDRVTAGLAPLVSPQLLDLTAITDLAVQASRHQWGPSAQFDWKRLVGRNRRYVRRFEMAIWIGPELQALCIGQASRHTGNVTLHYLERNPRNAYLKGHVAAMAVDAADAYARIIDRQFLKLKNPIPQALPLYCSLGFGVAKTLDGNAYYERRVQP